ncbi:sensor domain-containing diguanylate cyclase [Luteimonas sp. SDU101]|uniref:sensor domain-containing diguanylate cyclase n=1 Tax=Luteimonas sp. SDU101 TaxID=3422593 RepID=UPI003EBC7690
MGDPRHHRGWCSWLLCLLLLCPSLAGATELIVRELRDDPPAAEVLAGLHDARLAAPQDRPYIRQFERKAQWWRIEASGPVSAGPAPQLVMRSPFLYRVEAWPPGARAPTRHSLYGAHADDRYSHRALVIALPDGIPAGQAVWLRVEHLSSIVSPLSVEPLDQVHREDLVFVAWRSFVMTSLAVLAILGLAFWGGTGERSYGYFSAMLVCAIGYLSAVSGDFRWVPGLDALFGRGAEANRVIACLGVVFSNLFQGSYLGLRRKAPRFGRLLHVGTGIAAITAALSLFGATKLTHITGNFALLYSAAVLLVASAWLSLRGERVARVVLVSWSALMLFCVLSAAQMVGLWVGPTWLGQGLAGSFVLASLLLALGLSDKLLQLRRDRDHASLQATIDPVTKTLNRHGIEERLFQAVERARARAEPLSIAFVDVDRFKGINDRHGHSVGDQCLRIVSWRLRNQLRRQDGLGRYGGDEFLVVLPGQDAHSALRIAERMRVSVNCRPLSMPETSIRVTLSIGVAELTAGESMASLFERADTALYASKSAGRDRATGANPADGLWTT